jgi:hypothetical protein
MAAEPETDPTVEDPEAETSRLGAYDLDGDGKISMVEDARARLGVIDADLEHAAQEGGIKGKIAEAAHHIVDKLDND